MKLEGLIVPLITPLNDDESLDVVGLERLVEHVIRGGVHGIFVLGSSGEFAALDEITKERIVQITRALIGERPISLLAGIAETGTRRAIEQGRRVVRLGADAVVVTAPFYYFYSQSELLCHFQAVARSLDAPMVVYNIPPFVKMSLAVETVAHLVEEPAIIGLKDSAGDMTAFARYVEIAGQNPGFGVCQGAEERVADSLLLGADGLVLGLANIAPRLCRDLYDAGKAGDEASAHRLNRRLLRLYPINEQKSFLAGLKTSAHLLGLCRPHVTGPFEPLDERQTQTVRDILADLALLPVETT